MGDKTEKYISGPRLELAVPDCSLAEYFFPLLKAQPEDNIIQVDSVTGYAETSKQHLQKSLKVYQSYRKLGLSQDDVIAVVARNSSDVYAAVAGVFWLGGIVAPMDFLLKSLELKGIIRKVKPSAVVCDEDVVENVAAALTNAEINAKIIVLADKHKVKKPHISFQEFMDVAADVDGYKPQPVKCPATKIAMINTTSGSTGIPKGVGITHRNLIFQMKSLEQNNMAHELKSFLVTSHFYWVTCINSFLPSLATGMKKIYMRDVNPINVLNAVKNYKPECCLMSPGLFSTLTRQKDIHNYDFSCFKMLLFGGSPLSQGILNNIKNTWKYDLPLKNVYGTTEATGIIALCRPGCDILSVGKPNYDLKIKVIDPETLKALGPNERGEICFSSPGLMKGYVGDEDETKAVILGEWCRTGDLGYYDESGSIYIIDRLKELIKNPRNYQIIPSEIEAVIASIPGVMDAGVVGIFPEPDEFYLMALVVKKANSTVTESTIKDTVKENLASYKELGRVKFVDALPRSNIGKLKRRDLKEMAATLAQA